VNLDEVRAAVRGSIWQSMAQSGVNLTPIPKADQETLVDHITNQVLVRMDELMGAVGAEAGAPAPPPLAQSAAPVDNDADEQILWQGHPFLSPFVFYTVTTERVLINSGVLGKTHENIELVRVKDVDWHQGISERILGVGDVTLFSVDASDPKAVLNNVRDPQKVFEVVRRAMLAARKKYHIIFEQQM
jgi:hypothetical protein